MSVAHEERDFSSGRDEWRLMKYEQAAVAQYQQLAEALRQVGAAWVLEEVEELLARGKTVPLRDLPQDEQEHYLERLAVETQKGFPVGSAKNADEVGLPYEPHERLALLVDATERVVIASARSYVSLSAFVAAHRLQGVTLLRPAASDTAVTTNDVLEIPMRAAAGVEEKLEALSELLRAQVLD